MKKTTLLLLFLFSVVQAVTSQSDIQDTFLGCKLNMSKLNVILNLSKEAYTYYDNGVENTISIPGAIFGGFKFRSSELYFHDRKFYEIIFSDTKSNKEEAIELYNNIIRKLDEKYSGLKIRSIKNGSAFCKAFYKDDVRAISLAVIYAESRGGNMFYYVLLSYFDIEKARKAHGKNADEL